MYLPSLPASLKQPGYFFLVYWILITAYYVSAQLHSAYCTPWGWWGYIESPFLLETLHCRALKWFFSYSHDYIRSMWFLGSTFLVKLIMDFFSLLKKKV